VCSPAQTSAARLPSPPVLRHPPGLVHVQDLDEEQHDEARPGVEKVALRQTADHVFPLGPGEGRSASLATSASTLTSGMCINRITAAKVVNTKEKITQ